MINTHKLQIGDRLKIHFEGQWFPCTVIENGKALLVRSDSKVHDYQILNGHGFIINPWKEPKFHL